MILTKEKFLKNMNEKKFIEKLAKSVFIYPTDTIYGIGCNALDEKAVQRIRDIKLRESKPFSVIAPSKQWIHDNCIVNKQIEEHLKKLPGPYTLVMKLKNKKTVASSVNMNLNTIGVRIPDHWLSEIITKLNFPIVTTSVNLSGQEHMTSLENLNYDIKKKVDFIVYEGQKNSKPSTVINCTAFEIIRK
jgi:L-threonylcarbamoyladenylate synthase